MSSERSAAQGRPTLAKLNSLEFLVASKMDYESQYETLVQLLRLAGYEPTPDGVRRVES